MDHHCMHAEAQGSQGSLGSCKPGTCWAVQGKACRAAQEGEGSWHAPEAHRRLKGCARGGRLTRALGQQQGRIPLRLAPFPHGASLYVPLELTCSGQGMAEVLGGVPGLVGGHRVQSQTACRSS